MSAKSKLRSVRSSAASNPATTTGSIGVVVAIFGRYLGWDEQLQLDIVTLFLIAVPTARGFMIWWEARSAEEAEEAKEIPSDDGS